MKIRHDCKAKDESDDYFHYHLSQNAWRHDAEPARLSWTLLLADLIVLAASKITSSSSCRLGVCDYERLHSLVVVPFFPRQRRESPDAGRRASRGFQRYGALDLFAFHQRLVFR